MESIETMVSTAVRDITVPSPPAPKILTLDRNAKISSLISQLRALCDGLIVEALTVEDGVTSNMSTYKGDTETMRSMHATMTVQMRKRTE